jgi:tetratricopeptide (TPR) repeat protein
VARAERLFEDGARARREERREEARRLFKEALALEPAHPKAAVALAFLLREEGEGREAADALRPLVASLATGTRDLVAIAEFVAETGETDLALEALARAREKSRNEPPVLLAHGRLLLQTGRFAEARETFREAFDRDPEAGAAAYQWAQTRRWEGGDGEEALALLSARSARVRTPQARACFEFARAKIADDLGRTAEAFSHLRAANALRKRTLPPFDHAFYEEWLAAFASEAEERPRTTPAPHGHGLTEEGRPRPLFVVGLPRSGTTLLARLLLRRGDTAIAGELDLIGRLATRLAGPAGRPGDLRRALETLPRDEGNRLARAYLCELRARVGGRRPPYALDKNPLNLWFLPLIRVLFPSAPVLWCRRDPRDVLLSLYFQNFAHPALDFSYDLDDLDRHLASAARAGEALLARRDPALFVVDYEALVRDPEATLRAIDRGLGPVERTETAAESGRIATASAWQARQPPHTDSIGRWRRYAPFLLEAAPALARLGFTPGAPSS